MKLYAILTNATIMNAFVKYCRKRVRVYSHDYASRIVLKIDWSRSFEESSQQAQGAPFWPQVLVCLLQGRQSPKLSDSRARRINFELQW